MCIFIEQECLAHVRMSGAAYTTTSVSLAFAINKLKFKTKWNRMPPRSKLQ